MTAYSSAGPGESRAAQGVSYDAERRTIVLGKADPLEVARGYGRVAEAADGTVRAVVGARSALFLPFR